MAKQESATPRYWIFKDSSQNNFLQNDETTNYLKLWMVEPGSEVKPSDVVYFWREEDSSYFYGWGVIESLTAHLQPDEVTSTYGFGVQVRYHLHYPHPVMRGDLLGEPDLKSLSGLRQMQENIIELSTAQAAALNRLIRAREVEAPPDPLLLPSEKQTE
jgi:hypothetical protein